MNQTDMATTEKSNVTLIVYPPRRPHRCCLPSTPSPSSTSRRHLPYQCRVHGSVVFKALVMFGEQGRVLFMGPVMRVMAPMVEAPTEIANMEAEERVREVSALRMLRLDSSQ